MAGKKKTGAAAKAARTAFAGVMTGLTVVVLFLGNASGVLDLCAVAVTSFFVMLCVEETGGVYPFLVWAASSVLSLVLLPDKQLFLEYALFGGIYPILKLYFEKIPSRVLEWCAKLAYAAASFTAVWALSKFVLHLPDESRTLTYVLTALYLVAMIIYDFALTAAVTAYRLRLRPKLKFLNRLR